MSFLRRIKLDFIDYREKLGIGFDDHSKFSLFKNKVINFLNSIEYDIDFDEYLYFCNLVGLKAEMRLNYFGNNHINNNYRLKFCIFELEQQNTLNEFLVRYIALTNSILLERKQKILTRKSFFNVVCQTLKESHIPFDLLENNNEYFIFPNGAKELDDALVSQPLEWLKEYPKSQKSFIDALKSYSEATESNVSNIADLFRKALETFCQEFFKIDKSLENSISNYCSYLKQKGVPKEISNNFNKLLDLFSTYNNDYAKHHDKSSLKVLEFIMYQTGNLIRLPITLSRENCNNAD